MARVKGRIRRTLPVESALVYTFWDIGRGDMTSIWFMQKVGPEHRFIGYHEAGGEELNHFATYLQGKGYTYAKQFLPHEAAYKRIGKTPDTNQSIEEMLQELMPGHRFEVVPRVTTWTTASRPRALRSLRAGSARRAGARGSGASATTGRSGTSATAALPPSPCTTTAATAPTLTGSSARRCRPARGSRCRSRRRAGNRHGSGAARRRWLCEV